MTERERKKGLFSPIENREDALKTIRDVAVGFFVLAAIQGLIGFFLMPGLLVDAMLLVVLAAALMKWHSRVAAVLLLLVSAGDAVVTLLNRLGVMSQGGRNIFLAAIMIIAAVRAVTATFKLRGAFAASAPSGA
jgi:hypothetical protein